MKAFKYVIVAILVVIGLAIVAVLGINAYCILSTRGDVGTIAQFKEDDRKADVIVVLGASVKVDGSPSDILADRLEVACDLYKAGVAKALIVSGDNRTTHYNESDAMKSYCAKLGVPEDCIYVDHAGYNTYSSIYRAHFVYGANSAIVVTQAYHLYRAMMIGNLLGMTTSGVAADKGDYNNQSQYSLRDAFARCKDFFQAIFKIEPEEPTQPIGL